MQLRGGAIEIGLLLDERGEEKRERKVEAVLTGGEFAFAGVERVSASSSSCSVAILGSASRGSPRFWGDLEAGGRP